MKSAEGRGSGLPRGSRPVMYLTLREDVARDRLRAEGLVSVVNSATEDGRGPRQHRVAGKLLTSTWGSGGGGIRTLDPPNDG
jgi:hypothetical protein